MYGFRHTFSYSITIVITKGTMVKYLIDPNETYKYIMNP